MNAGRLFLIVAALSIIGVPAMAEENRSGFGIALTSGTLDVDVAGVDNTDFGGITVFWKYGFNDGWGLLLSYRGMSDREILPPGQELKYSQFGVYGVYMWRHGMKVRPHVKFGVANTDLELTNYYQSAASEDELAFSVGGGLEAGSQRVAFYADYDLTQFDISGIDFDVSNLSLGVIFKY